MPSLVGSEMCIRDRLYSAPRYVVVLVVVVMSKCISENMPVIILRILQKQLRVPGATRSPETARPRRVPPAQQPSRSPVKERASQPNSASGDFSKLPSRRRQVNTTFPFASAVERSILDNQSVSSNPPVSAFLLFFLLYVSSNPPVCYLYKFLLYC